jgi:phosphoenolpyruvate carboxykinase (ATP)
MPMHCSVNTGKDGDSAVFFGLSGTGKTTLSADPNRSLLGDDEHGWSDEGLFNFEGGCYAKLIRLSKDAEPEIFATTQMKNSVIENVVMTADGDLDLDDNSITENTRGAYPLDFIPGVTLSGKTSHPKNIIMLTADAFGILPPIAKLTPAHAMYHFLSGYTAKVAGTEMGLSSEPTATFSTCFGAPFMPRNPIEYGNLLKKKISEFDVNCWLVNTGWSGGVYGVGERISIKNTRHLLNEALSGNLSNVEMRNDANFGFMVPLLVDGIEKTILNPRNTWSDPTAYDLQANKLINMFIENFKKFEADVDENIKSSGPIIS